MPELYIPSRDAFTATFDYNSSTLVTEGGLRTRKEQSRSDILATVTWEVSQVNYFILMDAYRTWQLNPNAFTGANQYTIPLPIDTGEPSLVGCNFVPNSLSLIGVDGDKYRVQSELAISPSQFDSSFDDDIIDAFEINGVDSDELTVAIDALRDHLGRWPNGVFFPANPVAVAVVDPLVGETPLVVTLDGTGSSVLNDSIVEYRWDIHDSGGTVTLFGANQGHTFTTSGTFTVVLTVRAGSGLEATDSAEVKVDLAPAYGWATQDGSGSTVVESQVGWDASVHGLGSSGSWSATGGPTVELPTYYNASNTRTEGNIRVLDTIPNKLSEDGPYAVAGRFRLDPALSGVPSGRIFTLFDLVHALNPQIFIRYDTENKTLDLVLPQGQTVNHSWLPDSATWYSWVLSVGTAETSFFRIYTLAGEASVDLPLTETSLNRSSITGVFAVVLMRGLQDGSLDRCDTNWYFQQLSSAEALDFATQGTPA